MFNTDKSNAWKAAETNSSLSFNDTVSCQGHKESAVVELNLITEHWWNDADTRKIHEPKKDKQCRYTATMEKQ